MSTDKHPSRKTKQSNLESKTVANLRSLIQGSGSKLIFVNRTVRDRKKRLLKLQEGIAQVARRQLRSICNCQQYTVALSRFWEEFEAKMNIPCPIHGPCRLGRIVCLMGYPRKARDRRLIELLREYRRRCVTYQNPEVNHDEP